MNFLIDMFLKNQQKNAGWLKFEFRFSEKIGDWHEYEILSYYYKNDEKIYRSEFIMPVKIKWCIPYVMHCGFLTKLSSAIFWTHFINI